MSNKMPLTGSEWRAVLAIFVLFLPRDPVLGDLRAAGQHHRALGRRSH